MKTKFSISDRCFGHVDTVDEGEKLYNKWYKKRGFIYNKENEEVYKIFDKEIHLNIGDKVSIGGLGIITWKCYDIDQGFIEYVVEDE